MAHPEHLAILEKGVKVWNEWGEENRFTVTHLSGVEKTVKGVEGVKRNLKS